MDFLLQVKTVRLSDCQPTRTGYSECLIEASCDVQSCVLSAVDAVFAIRDHFSSKDKKVQKPIHLIRVGAE